MTTFTPGKYRMANGEQAIVVCDVGENPIGDSHSSFPLKGYTKSGPASWSRTGKSGFGFACDLDLLEPWTDPPTTLELLEKWRGTFDGPAERFASLDFRKLIKDTDARIAAEKAKSQTSMEKASCQK